MSRLQLLPLFLVILAGTAAGQGSPLLVPPAPLPGDASIGPAGGQQKHADAAGGGGVHLVAWADDRAHFGTGAYSDPTRDVYARRFDASGQPLDALPVRVSAGGGGKWDPRVAWNGAHFLVTWQESTPTASFHSAELLGRRVAPDGSFVDAAPFSIRKYAFSTDLIYGLGSDGAGWDVVVMGTSSGEGALQGWSVAADGTVSLANPQVIPSTGLLFDFRLVFDGARYLMTWGQPGVQALRLTPDLAPVGATFLVASGSSAGDASIATDGDGWLVAWTRGGTGAQIQYRPVNADGSMGPVTTCNPVSIVELNHSPTVAWTGTGSGYTLAWTRGYFDPTFLYRARITDAGALLDFGGIPVTAPDGPADGVVSSVGNGQALISWTANTATPAHRGDIVATPVSHGGHGPNLPASAGAPRHVEPHLAPGGGGYLATYASERDGSVSILAQRLDALGAAIDARPIELASGDALGSPRAAWNGQHFLVVWEDLKSSFETDDEILARRVGADGSLLDPAPFLVLLGKTPGVDAVGDVFLVAASTAETTEIFRIHAVRVDASGAILDASDLIVGSNYARWPEVASFGDRWVVAWQRNPTHDDPATTAWARVVYANGAMSPQSSLGGGSRPSVGASSAVAAIAWEAGDVLVRRMSPDGALLGGAIAAGAAPEAQTLPSIAWDGQRFVLAWEDARDIDAFFDPRRDVYAMRMSEAGALLDPAGGFEVSATADDERMPVVAGRDGTFLVALDRFVPGAPFAAMRVHVAAGGDLSCLASAYCLTSPNSAGPGALMGHSGSLSVSGNDLVLHAVGAVPGQPGLFYYGSGQNQLPFGDGWRCVGGPVVARLGVVGADAGGSASLAVDLTSPPTPAAQITSGSTWNFQYWYRDPAAGGAGFNLSNGLALTFCD